MYIVSIRMDRNCVFHIVYNNKLIIFCVFFLIKLNKFVNEIQPNVE